MWHRQRRAIFSSISDPTDPIYALNLNVFCSAVSAPP